jgi:hypothetical protein
LIAVSFDPRDKDLTVELSHARSKQSLFGEVEYELAASRDAAAHALRHVERRERELAAMTAERDALATVLASPSPPSASLTRRAAAVARALSARVRAGRFGAK